MASTSTRTGCANEPTTRMSARWPRWPSSSVGKRHHLGPEPARSAGAPGRAPPAAPWRTLGCACRRGPEPATGLTAEGGAEGDELLDLGQGLLVELDVAGLGVLADVLRVPGPGDRARHALLVERPRQRELRQRDPEAVGDGS